MSQAFLTTLATVCALWSSVAVAQPTVAVVQGPNGETYHCGSNGPLTSGDINNAFAALQATTHSSQNIYIDGQRASFGVSGSAEFYVCNNAKSRRYFTLNGARQSDMNNAFSLCGDSNSYWVDDGDGWTWGVDLAGHAECSFGATP